MSIERTIGQHDGDSSDAHEQEPTQPRDILEGIFSDAGIVSMSPEDAHESQFKRLPDQTTLIGNETFVFAYGVPVFYREKKLYKEPREDGASYEVRLTMLGDSGLLNKIMLTTREGVDTLEFGIGHPTFPEQYTAVKYTHGYFDRTAVIIPDCQAPLTPIVNVNSSTLLQRRMEAQSDPVLGDILAIYGEPVDPTNSEFEAIIFPQKIRNALKKWITRIEGQYDDPTEDPTQSWKHWFRELGISYKYQS